VPLAMRACRVDALLGWTNGAGGTSGTNGAGGKKGQEDKFWCGRWERTRIDYKNKFIEGPCGSV
jgi:hypothetical protein